MSNFPTGLEASPHGDALLPNRTGGGMRWRERQKEWEIVVSLQKARIVELEELLRGLADSPFLYWNGAQCLFCGASKGFPHGVKCELGKALEALDNE